MRVFEELATAINAAWIRHSRDEDVFPELARAAVERFAPHTAVGLPDILRWIVESERIPRQFDPHSSFGNLAVTVAARDGFYIDVLVWTDSTTSIHQHSFSGAFHVLHGSSLHSLWSFRESSRWSDRLKRGDLALAETEWLKTGTTRPIVPGDRMIHSLFHLENPSVTVVVRTPSAAITSPQMAYERSGLAYDPFFEVERVEKVRQTLSLLWSSHHPEREVLTEVALRGVDSLAAARIVSSLRGQSSARAQTCAVDLVAARDPELGALLRETVAGRDRERVLVDLRKQTASPRHRMLLALLLNLPDRAAIDRVLAQIFPHERPEAWIWESVRSMHDTPCRLQDGANVLGLRLNEVSEEALRILVRGGSIAEASAAIAEHAELIEDARLLCTALAASPVIGPLLQHL